MENFESDKIKWYISLQSVHNLDYDLYYIS